jgi:hypothetical protein
MGYYGESEDLLDSLHISDIFDEFPVCKTSSWCWVQTFFENFQEYGLR